LLEPVNISSLAMSTTQTTTLFFDIEQTANNNLSVLHGCIQRVDIVRHEQ
jgi:hypothetical protein